MNRLNIENFKGCLLGGAIGDAFSLRAPGNSCLSALKSKNMGTTKDSINDSKGCGGVMRVAPVGLAFCDTEKAFSMGANALPSHTAIPQVI